MYVFENARKVTIEAKWLEIGNNTCELWRRSFGLSFILFISIRNKVYLDSHYWKIKGSEKKIQAKNRQFKDPCPNNCLIVNMNLYKRWNLEDSILGQHISLLGKYSALNQHFPCPKQGCSIAEGFHFLHFPLDESYVCARVFTHTHTHGHGTSILHNIFGEPCILK